MELIELRKYGFILCEDEKKKSKINEALEFIKN